MPQVPLYGPRKVETRPITGVQRPHVGPAPGPDVFGAQVGEALQRAGVQGLNLALEREQAQRNKANQVRVLESSNQLEAQVQPYLRDPQTGVFNTRKGKDSFGLPEESMDWYENVASDIAGTLANDDQRYAFARVVAQTRDQMRLQVYAHVDREMETYQEAQVKAGVTLRVSSAIQNWDQPAIIGQKIDEALAITEAHLRGQDKTTIDAAKLAVTTTIHDGVINQMLANHQDRAAQIYYEETKTQIDGDKQIDIEKALKIGSVRGESQRQTERILSEGGTPEEMRAEAKKIEDPEVQDETLQRIEHEIATAKALKRDAHEELMTTASQLIFKSHRFDAVPPSMLRDMDATELTRLQTFAESLQPGRKAIETDPEIYQRLRLLAADDPETFKQLNMMDYLTKLSRPDHMRLLELQADLRAGRPKAEAELDGIRTNQQILDDTLHLADIDTGDTAEARKSGAAKEVAKVRQKLDEQVQALQRLTGKKATNADVQQLADDLLKSIVLEQGGWLNILPGGAPFRDVTKRVVDLTVTDIPKRDRDQIEQALRAAQRPVTPEAIVNLYLATKRRQGALK